MIRKTLPFGAIMALTMSANAAVIININQVGPDVVVTGSGSLNTAGLTLDSSVTLPPLMSPGYNVVLVGVTGGMGTHYLWVGATVTGSPIGSASANATFASNGMGDRFGIYATHVALPVGYVSGTSLLASNTYSNKTLSDLGLNVGSTVYSWGSGSTADSLTITVTAVPEPHQYAMLAGLGLVGMGLWRRHARR